MPSQLHVKMQAYVLFKYTSFFMRKIWMTLGAQKCSILSVIIMCVFVVTHMDKEVNYLYN